MAFDYTHYCYYFNYCRITVAATLLISHQMSGLNKEQRANLHKIEYVYKTLNKDYYKSEKSDKLSQAAIDGMVKELKDPYSEYMTKEQTQSFNEGVSGDFVGIEQKCKRKMIKSVLQVQ